MLLHRTKPTHYAETDDYDSVIVGQEERLEDETSMIDEHRTVLNPDAMQAILEVHQLPSPESSRSASPSVLTDESSDKGSHGIDTMLRHKLSGSLERPLSHSSSASSIENHVRSPVLGIRTELKDIPEENRGATKLSSPKINAGDEKVLKLSPREMEELTSEPASLPKLESPPKTAQSMPAVSLGPSPVLGQALPEALQTVSDGDGSVESRYRASSLAGALRSSRPKDDGVRLRSTSSKGDLRPNYSSRTLSTPPIKSSWPKSNGSVPPVRKPLNPEQVSETGDHKSSAKPSKSSSEPSRVQHLPLPPMSIHTYLQLELSSSRPSPLYINRSPESEFPYESSKVKFERLLNFLLLPPKLEHVLCFGALACLDSWLYTFTILPLRFFKAIAILCQWWVELLAKEFRFIAGFIYHGSGRMWHRQRGRRDSIDPAGASRSSSRAASRPRMSTSSSFAVSRSANGTAEKPTFESVQEANRRTKPLWGRRQHRRTKSIPSTLSSNHKADILQGLVIICSCLILMRFDASRMYHSIRGQAAIKLYVIYNVLEVGDRLFSALGQDIFECLFSDETLERNPDGRSKLLRPFGMFLLALAYNVSHATALFYQAITLNVAVNSYSNALLTLLMSNQFVEIKSTVFKKFEKENLFQLTCADVVERFQLWLMLLIIAMRNVVEVGGLSIMSQASQSASGPAEAYRNTTTATATQTHYFLLPNSFTLLPSWAGEVLSPFLVVLGSEMMVDWLKHAYVSKFNNVKPAVYGKFLDVLAKDYYNNAFVNQNLIKRLGLPVIPLSCLFIRASVQTYHMFLATQLPTPILSAATSLSVESAAATSPATIAVLEHFDAIIRSALGRSAFGTGFETPSVSAYFLNTDDFIALLTMVVFFLIAFVVLLACKLLLGMVLLSYARGRYRGMKERENVELDTKGRRVGGWGMVEVGEESRRAIYEGDEEGLKRVRDKEKKAMESGKDKADFGRVLRYELGSSKRIW